MGDRNPFSAKLVMTKEQFAKFEEDRNAILEKEIMHEFLEPSRTAAYFEEFDETTERYSYQDVGNNIIVYLNGHSKAINVEYIKRCCKLYTDKFAFLVFLCDGKYPSFYSIGLTLVEFDMDGLGTLRYSTNGFEYTNELNAPETVLVGIRKSDCGGVVGVQEGLDHNSFASWL